MSNEMLKPMTLRDALRDSPCPRPANGQPEDQNVGDCVDKGLCGCQNGEALRAAASAEPVGYGYSAEIQSAPGRMLHVCRDRVALYDTPLYTHPATDAEQCAQLAESHVGAGRSPDYDEACRDIAQAIRDTALGAQADAEIVAALDVNSIDDVDMRELLSAKDVGKGRAVLKRIVAALAKAKGGSAPVTGVDIDSLTGTADDQGNFANE